MREWRLSAGLLMEGLYRAEMRLHLKPYWGKPNVRNFRELAGNMRAKNPDTLYDLQGWNARTAPACYSTIIPW